MVTTSSSLLIKGDEQSFYNDLHKKKRRKLNIPSYTTTIHYRQTRRHKILPCVKEIYLRDDLGYGFLHSNHSSYIINTSEKLFSLLTKRNSKSINNKRNRLIILDTNILLHHMDVLEHPSNAIGNIVICQTALMACRQVNFSSYGRAIELIKRGNGNILFLPNIHHREVTRIKCTDMNDNNKKDNVSTTDWNIRCVSQYYAETLLGSNIDVVLLTDDMQHQKLISFEQMNSKLYRSLSMRDYIIELESEDPKLSLSDYAAQLYSYDKSPSLYEPHLSNDELTLGLKSGHYFQGRMQCDHNNLSKGIFNVIVRNRDEIVAVDVWGTDVNRAINGDFVVIDLYSLDKWKRFDSNFSNLKSNNLVVQSDKEYNAGKDQSCTVTTKNGTIVRPRGKVIGILHRNFRRNYCGTLRASSYEREHSDGSITSVFICSDSRIPPIFIRTNQRDHILGKMILVCIDEWPKNSMYPLGHYVGILGDHRGGKKAADIDTKVLLHEFDVKWEAFPACVLACLPPPTYQIKQSNDRLDFRFLPILSIDPPNCKDVDDALHCIQLPNDRYQIGVHIADVTYFVKPGSAVDIEASDRGTSTYLVDKRLDMLPCRLTTDLCSLKSNVNRYAFTVLWEVTLENDEVKIHKVDFRKSIVHSVAALTYQQAQEMIDIPDTEGQEETIKSVKRLALIARMLRSRRMNAGALQLASPSVMFQLDDTTNPMDIQHYNTLESNALVEEFMLLANITVGKKILRHYPTLSILRRHPAPDRSMFDALISKAQSRGFRIRIDDSKSLADSLDKCVVKSDPYINTLLRILSTRCLMPAQYFCSGDYRPHDWHHYGLAAHVYTHFTSPIRRYADICVHRLLCAAIGIEPLPLKLSTKTYLHGLATHLNRRHRNAQLAGRASVKLHTMLILERMKVEEGIIEDAYVLDVGAINGTELNITVLVPRYAVEGKLRLDITNDDINLTCVPEQHCITYGCGRAKSAEGIDVVVIQVFDKVKVKISVRVDPETTQKDLMLDLVEPKLTRN